MSHSNGEAMSDCYHAPGPCAAVLSFRNELRTTTVRTGVERCDVDGGWHGTARADA